MFLFISGLFTFFCKWALHSACVETEQKFDWKCEELFIKIVLNAYGGNIFMRVARIICVLSPMLPFSHVDFWTILFFFFIARKHFLYKVLFFVLFIYILSFTNKAEYLPFVFLDMVYFTYKAYTSYLLSYSLPASLLLHVPFAPFAFPPFSSPLPLPSSGLPFPPLSFYVDKGPGICLYSFLRV